jgi:hypothetical protein
LGAPLLPPLAAPWGGDFGTAAPGWTLTEGEEEELADPEEDPDWLPAGLALEFAGGTDAELLLAEPDGAGGGGGPFLRAFFAANFDRFGNAMRDCPLPREVPKRGWGHKEAVGTRVPSRSGGIAAP